MDRCRDGSQCCIHRHSRFVSQGHKCHPYTAYSSGNSKQSLCASKQCILELQGNLELQADVPSFSDWCMKKAADVPQFHYWYHTLQLELLLLAFVKSLREANFQLYKDALSKIVPGFFALDHLNYARWIPMHLRDMYALKKVAPDVALQFTHGNFVVHKASRHFSGIPIDQAHEQNNAMVKGVVPLSV